MLFNLFFRPQNRVHAALFSLILSLGINTAASEETMAFDAGHPEKVFDTTSLTKICGGFQFTEGPVWHPDGYLLFTDIPANRINRWEPGKGCSLYREPSHNSNGLTFDRKGRLLACEHGTRRVTRTQADGTVVAIAETCEGKRLNSPNDITVSSDGTIYFTDPPYGVASGDREIDFQGVYYIKQDGQVRLGYSGMNRPNGLALSPDEKILYVSDTEAMEVLAFPVLPEGGLGQPKTLGKLDGSGADGMKVDTEGNAYVTGPRGIWVWDARGEWIGLLETPEDPANCAFGGPDSKTLFITARTSLYQVRCLYPGIHPSGW